MLFDFVKRTLFSRGRQSDEKARRTSFEHANDLMEEPRAAIAQFREHLQHYPLDIEAMNNLGCCLVDIGDHDAAGELFEKAFSIDDAYLPVAVNYAKHLSANQRISEGLAYLRQAKAYEPDNPNVNIVYAGMALNMGDPDTARDYALKGWLGSFDNLRMANCYLFWSSYSDIDEARLAAEHRFWAETLSPNVFPPKGDLVNDPVLPAKGKKIRVAYWSPDFRNHSVRYFALPLLENHDRERFEIVIYHDAPFHDERTDAIKASCDHFIPVAEIPDSRLVALIRSHQIDILIELAGQSSANRLRLLQERLASRQLTGLGYPPTTGLSTIDGKFLDRHVADADAARYYTEPPLVLDHSFWCFDPKEQPAISTEPPVAKNGFITFACVGNIAKITKPILACWAEILSRVPDSRLLIRSISLNDKVAAQFIADRLRESAIDLGRVDFFGPAAGTDFFLSYNEIDIILDTYPFNGGTTTCFATYMGVPVVSLAGNSLLSRMGKSVLTNLELTDWIATDYGDYVEKAVSHAHNSAFLQEFRSTARKRYASTALGNGKLFTIDVEKQYVAQLKTQEPLVQHRVEALPSEELVSRAYAVLRHGQFEAARRIVDHCLTEYPDCGKAHVIWTHRLTAEGRFADAADYLHQRLNGFALPDRFTALVNIARFNIIANRPREAESAIKSAGECALDAPSELLQLKLLQAYLRARDTDGQETPHETPLPVSAIKLLTVLIVCDDDELFAIQKKQISRTCEPVDGLTVRYLQCGEKNRLRSYVERLTDEHDDALLIVQRNAFVFNRNLFANILEALGRFDIVGMSGAKCWDRMEWRHAPLQQKASSLLIPSGEAEGFYEINFSGTSPLPIVDGMAVLDGSFLAVRKAAFKDIDTRTLFDPFLQGGGTLLEEYFTHSAFRAGLKLAAHMNLGVVLDWRVPIDSEHLAEARWHIAQHMSLDPFLITEEDRTVASVPTLNPTESMHVLQKFLADEK